MHPDQHNSKMAKAMGLIFSMFDIASAREVPFGILQSLVILDLAHTRGHSTKVVA